MFLYHLTLQRASSIYTCVHGNFAGTKQQEVVVSRGEYVSLFLDLNKRLLMLSGKKFQFAS